MKLSSLAVVAQSVLFPLSQEVSAFSNRAFGRSTQANPAQSGFTQSESVQSDGSALARVEPVKVSHSSGLSGKVASGYLPCIEGGGRLQPLFASRSSIEACADDEAGNGRDQSTEKSRRSGSALVYNKPLPKGSLILPPKGYQQANSSQHCAIILLPGTGIEPSQYQALANRVQEHSDQTAWFAIPSLPLKAANPISTKLLVQQAIQTLKREGYRGDQVMLAGHSLAGIFLADALPNSADPNQISGEILLGSYTLRKDRNGENLSSKLPSLTVVGELDGLIRPTRIAEDYYHHISQNKTSLEQSMLDHAVVVVDGMNHMQYITGDIPRTMGGFDLEPEVSTQEAHDQVAQTIVEFIQAQQFSNSTAKEAIVEKVEKSGEFLQPLIDAMLFEGSYHLETPCHLAEEGEECRLGSAWTEWAQAELLNVGDDVDVHVTDEFHETWRVNLFSEEPIFYHPKVKGGKADGADGKLYLNLSTVTELVYDKVDTFDNAFFRNTPKELRVKLNSNQAALDALGKRVSFKEAVESDSCSQLNAKTIEMWLAKVPAKTLERYLEKGTPLKAGEDVHYNSGLTWIWEYLDLKEGYDEQGNRQVVVDSPTLKTAIDHPIPYSGGKDYCKAIPPSTLLGWVYTDSHRKR